MFSGCSMRVNNLLHSLTVAVWTWPDWVAGRCDNKERAAFYDKRVCNTWLGFSASTKQSSTFTLVFSVILFWTIFICSFLFSEIFNLNLRFAVYGKRDSKFFNDGLRWAFSIDWLLMVTLKKTQIIRSLAPTKRWLVEINEVGLRGKCHRTEVKRRTRSKCWH